MTKIKTRYDTAGGWSAANPVLLAGEKGIESDTNKEKNGDGSTAWNALPYATIGPASPAFTGTPTAPTPPSGNNTTRIATTQFVQTELAGKASTASPAFSGNPTAPTPAVDDDDTSIATTAWVNDAIAAAVADALETALLAAHPVGSVLITENPASPDTYLGGGTWVAEAEGRVLVSHKAADTDFDTVGETGGAKTHAHDLDNSSTGARIRIGSDGAIWGLIKSGTSRTHTRKVEGTGSVISSDTSTMVPIEGTSDSASSMPPYYVVYMWRRTA